MNVCVALASSRPGCLVSPHGRPQPRFGSFRRDGPKWKVAGARPQPLSSRTRSISRGGAGSSSIAAMAAWSGKAGPLESEAEREEAKRMNWVPRWREMTPVRAAVWCSIAFLLLLAVQVLCGAVLFNPTVWMYVSWVLVVWPMPAAVAVGLVTAWIAFRQSRSKAKEWEQAVLLAGSLVWLILVPLGSVHGYVDGWPLLLFAVYLAFFFISAVVRLRLYGELSPKSEDKQWDSTPSKLAQLGFIVSVVGGHWLAALEAVLSWDSGWSSRIAACLLLLAFVAHWNATYFLGKYFDRLVRPTEVVTFGPYRWVRHPIYGSYMMLFAGYCLALQAYWSLLFLSVACWLYYQQRTKIEEDMLVETFGDLYTSYRSRVTKKYFPFLI